MLVRPDQAGGDITHNLRTAVADPTGRLVTVYTGFDWKPADIIDDLARVAASN